MMTFLPELEKMEGMHAMQRCSNTPLRPRRPRPDTNKGTAVRTYERIAEELVQRGHSELTPASVAKICRSAERKLFRALLADPEIREMLPFSARRMPAAAAFSGMDLR